MLTKFIKYYLLASIIILVASMQLYKSQTTHQSQWKGGGFGMYTTINEVNGLIIVNQNRYTREMLTNADVTKKFHLENNLLYAPSSKHAQEFYKYLKTKKDTVLIQVFQPTLNTKNNTLSYDLVYEKSFTKN